MPHPTSFTRHPITPTVLQSGFLLIWMCFYVFYVVEYFVSYVIDGIVTRDHVTSTHERPVVADVRSQLVTPVWRKNRKMQWFLRIPRKKSIHSFGRRFQISPITAEGNDSKDNKLLLALEICANSCPLTLAFPHRRKFVCHVYWIKV